MKRSAWQWFAIGSLIVGLTAATTSPAAAGAETRPQYGGTLRVTTQAAPISLDPSNSSQDDSFARRNITFLVFETLVTADASGRLHPGLATAWATTDNRRWQFRLRSGVKFQDGTALTNELAAASLQAANPNWRVTSEKDSVLIEQDAADPKLPAELALPRNAIVKREADGRLNGTGPFRIRDWQPETKLVLAAADDYWQGRPYLDAIEIELGKSFHDQLIALELGRADVVEVAPEQSRRVATDGLAVSVSQPVELVALAFARETQTPSEKSLRNALALSVDRESIRSVLLQGAGQPAGGILPLWMTGYAFVFPVQADLARARHEREVEKVAPAWTVKYEATDPLAHLLAERIILNARDAGLTLQPTTATTADARLVRIPLLTSDPWLALRQVAASSGLAQPATGTRSVEDLYAAEQAMLAQQRLIPLFHLPVAYAVSSSLRDWKPLVDGGWNLADVWLAPGSGKP